MICLGFGLAWWQMPKHRIPSLNQAEAPVAPPTAASPAPSQPPVPRPPITALAASAPSPEIDTFRTWVQQFAASTPAVRATILNEGYRLAERRKPVFEELIRSNPEEALRQALPYSLIRDLPRDMAGLIEKNVSGYGDLLVKGVAPSGVPEQTREPIRRSVVLAGETLRAYVYGNRRHQPTQYGIPLNGVSLGGLVALSNTGRTLEPEEVADLTAAGSLPKDPTCSVSGLVVTADQQPSWLDLGGRRFPICSAAHHLQLTRSFTRGLQSIVMPSDPGRTNPPTSGEARTTLTQGTKKVLFMRLGFPDDPREPIGLDETYQLMNQVNEFYRSASYDLVQMVSTVTPLLILPESSIYYAILGGPDLLLTHARRAARDAGFDYLEYDLDIVGHMTLPSDNFEWCGLGFVGARGSWIQCFTPKVVAHELGHNLGLWHANASSTGKPPGPNRNPPLPEDINSDYGYENVLAHGYFKDSAGTKVYDLEYGDPNDWMGGGSNLEAQFSSLMKAQLRWLAPNQTQRVSTNGTYRVHAFDTSHLEAHRTYALRLEKDRGFTEPNVREYWIDHRSRFPSNPWLSDAVSVYWTPWTGTAGSAQLLDMTPGTPELRGDAGLAIGHTFSDGEANIHITPVGKGGTGQDEWIDVVVNFGPFPGNRAPEFRLEASTLVASPGQPITFSATDVTDADGDPVAFRWDFSDHSFGPNQATVTRTFSQTGDYSIRCEVSDLKGGRTSRHVAVRVGNPDTFTMSGRVIDQNGSPLSDVRVLAHGTAAHVAFTDSEGLYTITGLSSDVSTNAAFRYGYETLPLSFDNPTALQNGNQAMLDHLAQAIPVVSVESIRNALESGVRPGLFRLTRTGPTSQPLTVSLGILGTATPGEDYNAIPDTVTFPPGSSSLDLPLEAIDETRNEGRETVTLQLLLASAISRVESYVTNMGTNGIQLVQVTNIVSLPGWEQRSINGVPTWQQVPPPYILGQGVATLSILDDETPKKPAVTLTVYDQTALETGGDQAVVLFERDSDIDNSLTVQLRIGGTASNGLDTVLIPSSITFAPGQKSIPLVISARDDGYVEGDETVTIQIAPSPAYTASDASISVDILDNDLPVVTLSTERSLLTEANTNSPGIVVFSRDGDLSTELRVGYLLRGTAEGGADYATPSGQLTIPAGQASARLEVFPLRDATSEPAESIEVVLSSSTTYNVGNPSSSTLWIQDAALPSVSIRLQGESSSLPEANGAVTFNITRSGGNPGPLRVYYKVGGGADPGTDYGSLSGSVYFTNNATNVTVTLRALEDLHIETYSVLESILVVLAPGDGYWVAEPSWASAQIEDNDSSGLPLASFSMTSGAVSEADGQQPIGVMLSGDPDPEKTPVIVEYEVIGGSGRLGVDYELPDSPGMNKGWLAFNYQPTNGTRFFLLTNLSVSLLNNTETDGDRTVVFALRYPNLTYTNIIESTNEAGTAQKETNYLIYPTYYNLGPKRFHVLTIHDDDYNVISVAASRATTTEGSDSPGRFTFTRTGGTDRPTTVYFQITGSASPGSDYEPLPASVTFPVGSTQVHLDVRSLDDTTSEATETVRISLLRAGQSKINTEASHAEVEIVDSDGTIEFAAPSLGANEAAGEVAIRVNRTGSSDLRQSVSYQIRGITATAGLDYEAAAEGQLVFEPGQTTQDIRITLNNDALLESDETVELTLGQRNGGVPLSGQTKTILTIHSDDAGFLFATNQFTAIESDTLMPVSILRVGALEEQASVRFQATNGSATAGQDFTTVDLVISFAPGQSNRVVNVPLLPDTKVETDETISLRLTDPGLAAASDATASATGLIREDDCLLEFTVNATQAAENQGKVALTMHRVGGTLNRVGADFRTIDSTAVSPFDYQGQLGTFVLSGERVAFDTNGLGTIQVTPGETSSTLEITLPDDLLGEPIKQFRVALSNPQLLAGPDREVAVQLGTNDQVLVTLIDNETPGGVDGEAAARLLIDGAVQTMTLQPDERLVFGGDFTEVNSVAFRHIARLTPQGDLDTGFNPGVGSDGTVLSVLSQPDGRVLLGGTFTSVGGQSRRGLARVNSEGDLDLSFDPGFGANGGVRALAVNQAGQVVVGGSFTRFSGSPRLGLARLSASGALDTGFTPSFTGGSVNAIVVQPDGKLVVGGSFTNVNGISQKSLARLNVDGSLDGTFLGARELTGSVNALALGPEDSLLVGGLFARTGGVPGGNFVRLAADGSVAPGFITSASPDGAVRGVQWHASLGRIYVVGEFTQIGTSVVNRIARLRPDGLLDTAFEVGAGANGPVHALATQSSSAVYVGGSFTEVNRNARRSLARLHGDEKIATTGAHFALEVMEVDESVGRATVNVIRTGDPAQTFVLKYQTVEARSTATAGRDYVATNGTLTFASGVSTRSFSVTVIQDTEVEPSETLFLALDLPDHEGEPGGLDTARLVILDDETALNLSARNYSVTEGQGSVSLTVTRQGRTSGTASVLVSTGNGSAVAGEDFTAVNTRILFAANETSQSVTIPILDDTEREPLETFTVRLSLPSAGSQLGQAEATVIIEDNDVENIVFGAVALASDSNNNGIIDPLETVTVNVALRNAGDATVTNLTATLVSTNRVVSRSGPVEYGRLPGNGDPVTRSFSFRNTGTVGSSLKLILALTEGDRELPSVETLVPLGAQNRSFTNTQPIVLGGVGPASPYPSIISVAGLGGIVSKVTVTLDGLSHTAPGDLDFLVQAPNGQNTVILSDAGGNSPVQNLVLTLDDAAAAAPPASARLTSGEFRPVDYLSGDAFPAPAPPGPRKTDLAFSNLDGNGDWLLFAVDDTPGDEGSLSRGWKINLLTTGQMAPATDIGVRWRNPVSSSPLNQTLGYQLEVANHGPTVATGVVFDLTLPPNVDIVGTSPGVNFVTNHLIASIGSLALDESRTLEIQLRPTQLGQLITPVRVTSTTTDFYLGNNTRSLVTTTVSAAPLTLLATFTGATMRLSWPDGFGAELQEAASILGPWTSTSQAPTLNSGTWSLLLATEHAARFYRLVIP